MRILFAGTGDIAVPSLRYLAARGGLVGILTQPDRPAGRRLRIKAPAIKEEALRTVPGLPLLQPESPRLPEVSEWVRGLRPDVLVTMAYGRILPREILDVPGVACLNLHASLLPRHRGASPLQAAIASGDAESGITLMHMAEGLDTGDIVMEKRFALRRRETAGSLSNRLAGISPAALAEALDLLQAGNAPRFEQNHALATVTGKITRSGTMIDWERSAVELERKIRSLQPQPGAVAMLPSVGGEGVAVKIHSAIVARRSHGEPGTVLRVDARVVLVACGEGGLLLGTIQPEGKGRMHSTAFARGHALAVDDSGA